jgi:hypothetical protein
MCISVLSASAALDPESQIPASETLENQGLQAPKTDLGGKLRFEQINEVTWKLTDGSGVNAWDDGYRTTRALAGLMCLGNGKWIGRYKNRWSKPLSLNKAKTYLMEMVRGTRPGHVPADPIRELHLETLKAMGQRSDSPAPTQRHGWRSA